MATRRVAARLSEGPVPKHAQLRDALARAVRSADPGTAIASERELMQTYAVSRATVRRAIEALIADGVLHRIQGKGTFVAHPRVQSHLHLASFTTDMRRRGLTPTTRVVRVERRVCPVEVADDLGLAEGEAAWFVERVRLADGQPMAYERAWYPTDLLPGLDDHDLAGSLYDLVHRTYGLVVDAAEQAVWADQAGAAATYLDLSATAPVMVFDRLSRVGGRPLERVRSWYRGDRYQIHMTLDRSMAP
ncbi:GntR family transcriptional regulator [Arsenicicoccus dermatophilus]|uniref:GntR family transcriptional regulator n=1 Tax=Arsenicicoccus dermatophilus TaxID=1076331 RepID=UPI001F4D2440|nr:GntR family transcriptional regulator [Arsenicicoccus dermatophilus]MCH8611756.1 GntR family transcriptional regulator [Arsenicicoccus dermatophilus]